MKNVQPTDWLEFLRVGNSEKGLCVSLCPGVFVARFLLPGTSDKGLCVSLCPDVFVARFHLPGTSDKWLCVSLPDGRQVCALVSSWQDFYE
jgi:hypothetical protein